MKHIYLFGYIAVGSFLSACDQDDALNTVPQLVPVDGIVAVTFAGPRMSEIGLPSGTYVAENEVITTENWQQLTRYSFRDGAVDSVGFQLPGASQANTHVGRGRPLVFGIEQDISSLYRAEETGLQIIDRAPLQFYEAARISQPRFLQTTQSGLILISEHFDRTAGAKSLIEYLGEDAQETILLAELPSSEVSPDKIIVCVGDASRVGFLVWAYGPNFDREYFWWTCDANGPCSKKPILLTDPSNFIGGNLSAKHQLVNRFEPGGARMMLHIGNFENVIAHLQDRGDVALLSFEPATLKQQLGGFAQQAGSQFPDGEAVFLRTGYEATATVQRSANGALTEVISPSQQVNSLDLYVGAVTLIGQNGAHYYGYTGKYILQLAVSDFSVERIFEMTMPRDLPGDQVLIASAKLSAGLISVVGNVNSGNVHRGAFYASFPVGM